MKRAQQACAGPVSYADLLQQRSVLILRVAQLRFQAGLLRLRGLQLLLSFLLSSDRFYSTFLLSMPSTNAGSTVEARIWPQGMNREALAAIEKHVHYWQPVGWLCCLSLHEVADGLQAFHSEPSARLSSCPVPSTSSVCPHSAFETPPSSNLQWKVADLASCPAQNSAPHVTAGELHTLTGLLQLTSTR